MMKKVLTTLLFLCLCASLAACAGAGESVELTADITPVKPALSGQSLSGDFVPGQMKFSVELLKQVESEERGKNLLISPLSLSLALSLAANGAQGETLAQMMQTLSGGMPLDRWNQALYEYTEGVLASEASSVGIANSLWLRQGRIAVNPSFLQTAADYYGAEIYEGPFDRSTVKQINRWVGKNTDGMIDQIVDEIPDEAVTYLLNALVFEADWRSIYYKNQVSDGVFTAADGTEEPAQMMYDELYAYLETEGATGFVKYYDGGKFCFAALLPEEGTDVPSFVASLTADQLSGVLNGVQRVEARTKLPKFSYEYAVEMDDVLISMGMAEAFDPNRADFSGMGTAVNGNPLYIESVVHKAYIEVAEQGTKAAAVTRVAVGDGEGLPEEEPRTVYLDRPFVWFIVDTEYGLPLFMGIVNSVA